MTDLSRIISAKTPLVLSGVTRGAAPLLLADLARGAQGRVVHIAEDEQAMRAIADTAHYFAPELEVISFPAWDCLPYDRASPALNVTAERLSALHRLQAPVSGAQLLVTTVNALLQRVLTPFRVRQNIRELKPGMTIGRESLIDLLSRQGYVRTDTVADAGEYAVRGSVFDIYPSGLGMGLRLDFFGDELETLRSFDPSTQRTIAPVASHLLLPASEVQVDAESIKRFRAGYLDLFGATATGDPLYQAASEGRRLSGIEHFLPLFEDKMVSLIDHIGDKALITMDPGTPAAATERLEAIADYQSARAEALAKGNGAYRPLPADRLYLDSKEYRTLVKDRRVHRLSIFPEEETAQTIDFHFSGARDFRAERANSGNIYAAAGSWLKSAAGKGRKTIIAAYSEGSRSRIAGLLAEESGLRPVMAESWQEALGAAALGKLAAIILPLESGFSGPDIDLITEQDLLGDRLVRRKKRKRDADAFLAELNALATGDLVVHEEHGIGRYEGLMSIPVGKSPHDCVMLSYAGGDKLYVPVENIDVLTRFGSDAEGTSLDKLGGEAWQRRKAKLKERIRAIAGQLMATAAARAMRTAEAVQLDDGVFGSFTDRFPYQETEDQERVIAEVLDDLRSGKPMDRLVCGDVGFGKTEVAMRAAFAAAMSGMQVAVIAPTTLLARQHYTNFAERFEGFPLKVGRLSRLVPAGEAAATRAALTDGTMDVVIGTHALLAKSVDFKRLGLVIIDEEQRFGVVHKERLKELKADVHVLTLTATPIPRTLQMAMSGLRELSVIQTPPVDRLAVRTYVMPWDGLVIREALLREHHRGGQSFIVVPRIADLEGLEDYLRAEVPEVKFVAAHGQMSPVEVEDRMSAFYERRYDVLLSTTIVESGLDIPSANTLIIHRAERFGLAQLYQLRGRVGRAKVRAYAYLTTPENRALSEIAEKRLKVLSDLDSLGAGFQLASHDLDIRGAGNLVGDEQSGHIREVGFELYQSMLEDAILELRASGAGLAKPTSGFSPQITVDAPIMIAEDYVPDLSVRMALYRRMNDLTDKAQIEGLAAEIIDRFGALPEATSNLLKLIEVKQNCVTARVTKIDVGPRGALVTFHEDGFPDIQGLLAYVERLGGVAKLRPDNKLMINRVWGDPVARMNGLVQLSKGLAGIVRRKAG